MKISLFSFNNNPLELTARSSYISHSNKKVFEIFESNFPKPLEYIKKIINMGHLSVLEHVYFNFLVEEAPIINEIFLIRFRLASFTVKSRRYTNVLRDGFYEDNTYRINESFSRLLTDFYQKAVDKIPLEDARFVLPFSSKTNMIFSVNARELGYILFSGLYENNIPSVKKMCEKIFNEVSSVFPIYDDLTIFSNGSLYSYLKVDSKNMLILDDISVLNLEGLDLSLYEKALGFYFNKNFFDKNDVDFKNSLRLSHNRALEFIPINLFIKRISVPALTHLLRHRIQSIIFPSLTETSTDFIIPESFKKFGLEEDFINIILMSTELERDSILNRLVSSTYPVLTNINAREMIHIMKLRLCKRAQWEIRDIFTKVLFKLREKIPHLFDYVGPNCYTLGFCPEGVKTCGSFQYMTEFFRP